MASRRQTGSGSIVVVLMPVLAVLSVGFLAPMGVLLWTSLHHNGTFGLAAYAEVLQSATTFDILRRTVLMAASATFGCLCLGYPLAYVLATRAGKWADWLLALIAVPYLTSVLIRSYAWVAILGANGVVNRTLLDLGLINEPLSLVFNTTGSLIGMIQILLPMAVLPIYASMQRIAPALLLAARSLGAGPSAVFLTVFLPLSASGALAGCSLVFLNALGFYVTPALLGSPGDYLIAQAIEVRVTTLAEFDVASAQAWLLLLLVAGVLFLARRWLAGSVQDEEGISARRSTDGDGLRANRLVDPLRRLNWPGRIADLLQPLAPAILWVHTTLILAFLLAPMLVVVGVAFSSAPYLTFPPPGYSLRWFATFWQDPQWLGSAAFSLVVSSIAALTSLLVATPLAFVLARHRIAGQRLLWLLAVSPMIVPHIVIALGLFFTFVALRLNGSPVTFWLAYSLTGVPYVVIIMLSAVRRFDFALEHAGASLGGRPLTVFRTITFPLLRVSALSAFFFAFLVAFDDLIISLFLSTPSQTTLAMRMWEDIRLEISPKTAVVGVLQLAVLVLVMSMMALLRRRQPRGARQPEGFLPAG